MTWQIGLVADSAAAIAYLAIAGAIALPLARSGQLRTNPLAAATSAIFLTCAVHHGAHSVQLLLPSFGVAEPQGLALRSVLGLAAGHLGRRRRRRRDLLLDAAPQPTAR